MLNKTLYDEAIDAAEQIKFATEQKVKQQLVESLSPKIKQMVENSFLFEGENEEVPNDEDDSELSSSKNKPSDDDEKKPKSSNGSGPNEIHEQDNVDESDCCDEEELGEISESSRIILTKLLTTANKKSQIINKIKTLRENYKKFYKTLLLSENTKKSKQLDNKMLFVFKNLTLETKNVEKNVKNINDKSILKEYIELIKEIKYMSTRQRRKNSRFLNESLDDLLEMNLFEADDDEDQDKDMESEDQDEDMDLEDSDKDSDEDSDEDFDFDLDSSDDDDDVSSMSGSVSPDTTIQQLAQMAGLMSDEEEMPEMEDEEEEEPEMEESWAREGHVDEMYEDDQEEGAMIEIDESILRKEIKRMKALREGEASAMAHHFGGGKKGKEMFVDVDERDLNVHSGHLGREDVPSPKVESIIRKTARKNRMLESKIQEYKKALQQLKTQLTEMNLFNAKLLYANKLMQNKDLSIKQQKNIVESLDNAKTLGEAKILFESLSKAQTQRTPASNQTRSSMNESVSRSAGASSRPVQSAQVLNESVALDRWATLAGLKK